MSIWYRKRIRINTESIWMGFLRCRSCNRQELEQEGPNRQSPRIREAPGGQGRRSPFELTNVELEGQVRWWNRLDLSASAAGRMRLRRLECRRILTQPVDQTLSPQDWQGEERGGKKGKRKGYEEEKERGTRRRFSTFSLQAGVGGRKKEKEEVKKLRRRYTAGLYGNPRDRVEAEHLKVSVQRTVNLQSP